MIATILHSSPSFNAVDYNERKVSQGSAFLIVMENMGGLELLGRPAASEMRDYLTTYTSMNPRVRNGQFHLAVSCRGHEWTQEQLLRFTREYLREMGYGEDGQPLLVYAHADTDNTHLHIITSRVRPDGKKISDSRERIRSQVAIDRILRRNPGQEAVEALNEAGRFACSSLRQYKSVLEAMGYKVFEGGEEKEQLILKKGGRIVGKVRKESVIVNHDEDESIGKQRKKVRALLLKSHDSCADLPSLDSMLHCKFGLKLVTMGPKDNPFGYHLVDFKNKCVWEGNRLLPLKSLLDFQMPEERSAAAAETLSRLLNDNPWAPTAELRKKLRRHGIGLGRNSLRVRGHSRPLDPPTAAILKRNDKLEWVLSFNPASGLELGCLCRMAGLSPELGLEELPAPVREDETPDHELFTILSQDNESLKRLRFRESGYRLVQYEGHWLCFNPRKHTIRDLTAAALPESMYKSLFPSSGKLSRRQANGSGIPAKPTLGRLASGGANVHPSSGTNREWEVQARDSAEEELRRSRGY